jgi:hypothetical protein
LRQTIRLAEQIGGTRKTDKLFYRLDGEALDKLGT